MDLQSTGANSRFDPKLLLSDSYFQYYNIPEVLLYYFITSIKTCDYEPLCSCDQSRDHWCLALTCTTHAPVNSAVLHAHSISKHESTACVTLQNCSWIKIASFHEDYMCLVTVHGWNFTVSWCKWVSCGSSRGVETLQFRESQLRGKSRWLDCYSEGVFQRPSPALQQRKKVKKGSKGLSSAESCSSTPPWTGLHQYGVFTMDKCGHFEGCDPNFGCLDGDAFGRAEVTFWPLLCWPLDFPRNSYKYGVWSLPSYRIPSTSVSFNTVCCLSGLHLPQFPF